MHECVSHPVTGATLFETYDDDQDGDLDLYDVRVFSTSYDYVPKTVQSEAELVFTKCCIPETVISEIAECLSGPIEPPGPRDQPNSSPQPLACALEPYCTAGFSAPLEPGDWLYKTCAQSAGGPAPDPMHCYSWQTSEKPAVFECRAAHLPGLSLFVLIDFDNDEDVDLFDFAELQRDIVDGGR